MSEEVERALLEERKGQVKMNTLTSVNIFFDVTGSENAAKILKFFC